MATRKETIWDCDATNCNSEVNTSVRMSESGLLPKGWTTVSINYNREDGQKRVRIMHLCEPCSEPVMKIGEGIDVESGKR